MDKQQQGPTPQTEGVWPPAPLRDDPPPLFLRLEGMQLTRSGDRLVVLNLSIRRVFLFQVCILSLSLLSPVISFWTSPLHHATLPSLLAFVISDYRFICGMFLFMLFPVALFWWVFTFFANMGGATLDRHDRSVKAGGRRARPVSRIKAIEIRPTPNALFGIQHVVSLQWGSEDPTRRWQKALIDTSGNKCFLGALRHEAHAEEVAALIAGFIGVPVQRETMLGTRPAPIHPGTRP